MITTTIGPLIWNAGPPQGGGGTAGKDDNGAALFYNGDRLLLIIDTNHGREMAVIDIDCDEDYFRVTDASTGDNFDAWGPESWEWWAVLDKKNLPPLPKSAVGEPSAGALGEREAGK
jgi:hypothetical protein